MGIRSFELRTVCRQKNSGFSSRAGVVCLSGDLNPNEPQWETYFARVSEAFMSSEKVSNPATGEAAVTPADNKVLDALLERLYAALARGPALNAQPGNSRQRADLSTLERIDGDASVALADLLGEGKSFRALFTQAIPPRLARDEEESPEAKRARVRYDHGQKLLRKLAAIAREADTYQRDTGTAALYIGYPLLHLPEIAARGGFGSKRLLAPLAFIPVKLEVATGSRPGVTIKSAAAGGGDRVIANVALKTWIERQTGKSYPELFQDDEGNDPLREIAELALHVAETVGIKEAPKLEGWPVVGVPETKELGTEPTILPCAVMGLFPISKQGAIRDLEEIKSRGSFPDTVRPFITLDASLTTTSDPAYVSTDAAQVALLPSAEEHLVDWADPCQRRAVIRARATRGLVVHGPPGTGKSQTITNIIGDYLARKKKVLLVCEKRTALDVVKYRLDARGLGKLCAVVHDATSDRTALYSGIREQLDALSDTPLLSDPSRDLDRLNREMDSITAELRDYYARLAEREPDSGKDFHELMGLWLHTAEETAFLPNELDPGLGDVRAESLRENEGTLRSAYRRLIESDLADNGWDGNHRLTLDEFLSRRMDEMRRGMDEALGFAREAREKAVPEIPAFVSEIPIEAQAQWRSSASTELTRIGTEIAARIRMGAAALSPDEVDDAVQSLGSLEPQRDLVSGNPLAADLQQSFNAAPLPADRVAAGIPALANYLAKALGFFGFLQFGVKKAAAAILAPFGLPLDETNARRVKAFLEGVRARTILRAWLTERIPRDFAPERLDAPFVRQFDDFAACVRSLHKADRDPEGKGFGARFREAMGGDPASLAMLMKRSAEGARAMRGVLDSIEKTNIFAPQMIARLKEKLLSGRSIDDDIAKLREDLECMEPLLRFAAEVTAFPAAVGTALKQLARQELAEDLAWRRLLAGTLAGALEKRLRSCPALLHYDSARIEGNFRRVRELTAQKHVLEAQRIQFLWQATQREHLLASTGSRLNSNGADLRRRLMLRGKQASRIREVLHEGRGIVEGDPLFDIHPVWMTSPETATLILPSEKIFDAVIFDEASQCRLEEGLPVLLRGENIVIAGDTKQLPPTRFFESAVVSSDASEGEDEGQEGLFQSQQSDIEDLLSASLNIEIEQAYLDVHYRSSNEDLIRFSNESFYGSRLQAIPAHPNSRAKTPPIVLHRVDGTYENRRNPAEAAFIVGRVRELLAEENPPTIGIVSFNLTQKDLIEEALDQAAEEDLEFRERLSAARVLQRAGGFEGLFVKNLENVQGDERDVILISTTYGPTTDGKFFRRFGPLGQAGGERRLNVIVTRARRRVELATSIPSAVYRAGAESAIPAGRKPNGAWYLMRYLREAEVLEELYKEEAEKMAAQSEQAEIASESETKDESFCVQHVSGAQSLFTETFARLLLQKHQIGSHVYYGNDGFYVDLAFRHPDRADDVTIGVLFDGTRYGRAQDRVEWDGFKRVVLESQRWELHRVWTPHFLRDPEGTVRRLVAAAEQYAARDPWESERATADE